ncbi:MAG: alpha/beta hydrolase [Deltaproteobacteria bacterium]|nr:alpha/beta hydrolase [Deltaproteobacteria bacterium]
MSNALINGVNLYYEVHGEGFPLIWSHEFAGDCRSWESQVRFFTRRYQVIVYNARGYPPSDVPTDLDSYSQEHAVEDLRGLLHHLGIGQAHIGGLSMGGSTALNFGLTYPHMARSLIVAGTGTGSSDPELFRKRLEEFARRLEVEGMAGLADYTRGPQRIQLLRKDPKGWREFADYFSQHSGVGSALTFRGIQGRRPPIFELEEKFRALDVPTLIMVGDEDDPCIEPSFFMKRCISRSGLVVFPQAGHTINLEDPDQFNRTVLDFLTAVETGKWAKRDPGAASGALV